MIAYRGLKVLLVEDDPDDFILTRDLLTECDGYKFELHWVATYEGAVEAIRADECDAILLDYRLGERTGLELLREIERVDRRAPVIMLTGQADREIDFQAMWAGASDFLTKDRLDTLLLERSIRYAVERKRSEEMAACLAAVVEASEDAISRVLLDGTIVTWNRGGERIFGRSAGDALHAPLCSLFAPEEAATIAALLRRVQRGESVRDHEVSFSRGDQTRAGASLSFAPIRTAAGVVTGISMIARDITDRRRLEGRLRQADKMEAVGRLAGGIAHDFNNLLTTIAGTAEVMLMDLPPDDPRGTGLQDILYSTERGGALTRQLLAFGRQQVSQPQVLDLNRVVARMSGLLQRLNGEDVETRVVPEAREPFVHADQGQVEQIVMNLVLNAWDAVSRNGCVEIRTADVELDAEYCRQHTEVQPGPFVRLTVHDDGCGMDGETLARVFDPFFTTKESGGGVGLGLSTVHGNVRQAGGIIEVTSQPGVGTTFDVYFPRTTGGPAAAPAPGARMAEPCEEAETVLVAEDEAMIRLLVCQILRRHGYTVLEAADGEAALRTVREHQGRIDAIVTDIVMPRMGGIELVEQARTVYPAVRTIFLSGYSDRWMEGVPLHAEARLITKPFAMTVLLKTLRDSLASGSDPISA